VKRAAMLLFAGFVAGCGQAQAPARPDPTTVTPFPDLKGLPPRSADPTAAIVARYDKNGDGVLDAEEKAALRRDVLDSGGSASMRAQMAEYDSDGNGTVDAWEMERVKRDRETRAARFRAAALPRYDKNGNGILEPEEQAAMQRDNQAFVAQMRARMLAKYDRNRNGVLDPDERAALEAAAATVRARAQPSPAP